MKGPLSKEAEPPKGAKQPKVTQTLADRRGKSSEKALALAPIMILDGAPLPADASIRNFQHGRAGYVADAVEQALLLPKDMAALRSLRRHEVILGLKRDFAMVSPLTIFVFPLL